MPRVMHFDIGADNPDRAAKFYSDTFGWKIEKWEGPMDYWMLISGEDGEPGINGGMMRRTAEHPIAGTINTIVVESLDEYVDKIPAAGGKIVVPRMTIPKVGYLAYFNDTEGNMLGVMEPDESAE